MPLGFIPFRMVSLVRTRVPNPEPELGLRRLLHISAPPSGLKLKPALPPPPPKTLPTLSAPILAIILVLLGSEWRGWGGEVIVFSGVRRERLRAGGGGGIG